MANLVQNSAQSDQSDHVNSRDRNYSAEIVAEKFNVGGQAVSLSLDAETGELVDQLLDGRNRLGALNRTSLTEAAVEFYEGDDPVDFIVSLNLTRRHLTTGQRAALAVSALPYYEESAKGRQVAAGLANIGQRAALAVELLPYVEAQSGQSSAGEFSGTGGDSRDLVAERFGVSNNTVTRAKSLSQNAPDLFGEMKAGLRTVNNAYDAMKKRQDASSGLAKDDEGMHPLVAAADRVLERLAGLRSDLKRSDNIGRRAIDTMAAHEQAELFSILAKIGSHGGRRAVTAQGAELVRVADALALAAEAYIEPMDDFETVTGHPLTSLRERLSGYWAVRRACPEGRTPHTEEWAGDTMYACGCPLRNDGGVCG